MRNSITFRNFKIRGSVSINGTYESDHEHDEHKIHDLEKYNNTKVDISLDLDGTMECETDAPIEFYKEVGSFLIETIKESNTTRTITDK